MIYRIMYKIIYNRMIYISIIYISIIDMSMIYSIICHFPAIQLKG